MSKATILGYRTEAIGNITQFFADPVTPYQPLSAARSQPGERPDTSAWGVHLTTMEALGLTLPPTRLGQAEEVTLRYAVVGPRDA